MYLKKPKIFKNFPEIIFGFSKKVLDRAEDNFNFNLSYSIGDNLDVVSKNRIEYLNELGIDFDVVIQKQIHSDIVNIVNEYLSELEGDALITSNKNLGLGISAADCTNIYMYDPVNKIISAVHSGWAGTEKKILEKVISIMNKKFNVNPQNLFVYIGPTISQRNYEVGSEFKNKFNRKYLSTNNEKYHLDLKVANLDILKNSGIPEDQIEISDICTYSNKEFHSFRRDKSDSGRALGIIAMR